MLSLRYILKKEKNMETFEFILGALAISTGIIIPVSVFFWLYKDAKNKRKTVIEISRNIKNPDQLEKLINIFDERKKEPIDYRRGGVITLFVGIGISLLGFVAMGNFFQAVGYLVATIGVGILIAGYLYPNTGKELTDAVEEYEKK